MNPLYEEDSAGSTELVFEPGHKPVESKYTDTFSSCSDSEIMEIFERSTVERRKRKKGWDKGKMVKKRKLGEIQVSGEKIYLKSIIPINV